MGLVASALATLALAGGDLRERAGALVSRAWIRTVVTHPGCMWGANRAPDRRAIEGMPDAGLSAALGLLRRPQTAEERRLPVPPERWPLNGDHLFAGATRIATAANGMRFSLTVGRTDPNANVMVPSYDACAALRRRVLNRMLRGRPARLRRAALRADAEMTREARPQPLPPNAVTLQHLPQGAFFGGPVDAGSLDVVAVHGGRVAFGLVPDGIASVTLRYRRGLTRSAPVADNVYAIALAGEGHPRRVLWRDAAGTVVRATTPPAPFSSGFVRG